MRKSKYRIPRKHYLTIFFDNQYLSNAFWFYNLQTTYSKVSNNMLTLKCTSSYQKRFRIALPMHKKLNPTQRESWWRKSIIRKLNSLLILSYTHIYIYETPYVFHIYITNENKCVCKCNICCKLVNDTCWVQSNESRNMHTLKMYWEREARVDQLQSLFRSFWFSIPKFHAWHFIIPFLVYMSTFWANVWCQVYADVCIHCNHISCKGLVFV